MEHRYSNDPRYLQIKKISHPYRDNYPDQDIRMLINNMVHIIQKFEMIHPDEMVDPNLWYSLARLENML